MRLLQKHKIDLSACEDNFLILTSKVKRIYDLAEVQKYLLACACGQI